MTKKDDIKLIDKAFVISESEFKDKPFSTSQLWKLLVKKMKLQHDNSDEYVNFYVDLLQDPRFVAIGNDKWKLRNYVSKDEFDKLANSKYSNVEYSTNIDKDDEKIIDTLIDEDILETDINPDDIASEEYVDEDIEDSNIDSIDEEEQIEEDEEEDDE